MSDPGRVFLSGSTGWPPTATTRVVARVLGSQLSVFLLGCVGTPRRWSFLRLCRRGFSFFIFNYILREVVPMFRSPGDPDKVSAAIKSSGRRYADIAAEIGVSYGSVAAYA